MNNIYSISNLVNYLKLSIDNDQQLKNISIQGEISNISYASSGHIYFNLKDTRAKISCVFFKFNQKNVQTRFKDGDLVIVQGDVSVYEVGGNFQFYVKNINLSGIGELFLKFEILKNKLAGLGMFDLEYKKAKPEFPMNIAVIVGKDSAAESDIRSCFLRRWPLAKVDYYYALVQGNNSAKDICKHLENIDQKGYDAIILARGGGSIEDLWSFNDENLAYCIYKLNTFIITGIGHQQDFTIADFVADLRAATPTAAVELLSPDYTELINDIKVMRSRLKSMLLTCFNKQNNKLLNYKNFLNQYKVYLKTLNFNLNIYTTKQKNIILNLLNKNINDSKNKKKMLKVLINKNIQRFKNLNSRYKKLLEILNPLNTLKRGYAIIYSEDRVITSVGSVVKNDSLKLKLSDGEIEVVVKEIINGN